MYARAQARATPEKGDRQRVALTAYFHLRTLLHVLYKATRKAGKTVGYAIENKI